METAAAFIGRLASRYLRTAPVPLVLALVLAAVVLLVALGAAGMVAPAPESVVMAPWRW